MWTGPGDIPCDCLIIRGVAACDESMLTGESMPARKVAISNMDVQGQSDSKNINPRHTLFAGSKILHAGEGGYVDDTADLRDRVICVVAATGISTSKGQLVSAILFPTILTFNYDVELVVVICILAVYATGVVCAAVVFLQSNGSEMPFVTTWACVLGYHTRVHSHYWASVAALLVSGSHAELENDAAYRYATFTASQTLSPLLPVALRTGEQNASKRLGTAGIFCLNPKRISIAGKIRVFCFDKTGTLTQSGLEFCAAQWCQQASTMSVASREPALDMSIDASTATVVPSFSFPAFDTAVYSQQQAPIHVLRGMACCHAVTVAPSSSTLAKDDTLDNAPQELSGNEVEVRMFRASGWSLLEGQAGGLAQVLSPSKEEALEVLARNEFDHHRMTMSVVVRCVYASI